MKCNSILNFSILGYDAAIYRGLFQLRSIASAALYAFHKRTFYPPHFFEIASYNPKAMKHQILLNQKLIYQRANQ